MYPSLERDSSSTKTGRADQFDTNRPQLGCYIIRKLTPTFAGPSTQPRVNLMGSRFLAIVLSLTLAVPVFAHDGHRELGAHVHGRGILNIAVESTRVSLEITAPGMDIVGFEHEAKTSDQKAMIEEAKSKLGEPLALFKIPDAAGCKLADVNIEIAAEGQGSHHHNGVPDHDHGADDHKPAEKAEKKHYGDHRSGHAGHDDAHASFYAAYTLDCAKPERITSIGFQYFDAFAGAQELEINIVTATSQNTYEVSRGSPSLELAGGL